MIQKQGLATLSENQKKIHLQLMKWCTQAILLLIGCVLLGWILVSLLHQEKSSTLYSGAYAPLVEKSKQYHEQVRDAENDVNHRFLGTFFSKIEDDRKPDELLLNSNQPRPAGFFEREIEKQYGVRYKTY